MSGCVHCLVVGLVPEVGVNRVMVSSQTKEKEVATVPAVEAVTEQVTIVCILPSVMFTLCNYSRHLKQAQRSKSINHQKPRK